MDRTTLGDGSFRFGESSGDGRREASSNHEGIEEVDKFVEMRHLTLITDPMALSGASRRKQIPGTSAFSFIL